MADERAIKRLDEQNIPYVLFRKIKNFVDNGTYEVTEKPQEFVLRLDSSHNVPTSIQNFLQNGCVIVGHQNLKPNAHGDVLALLNGMDSTKIDPRLLESAPKSALKEKVANEQRK